MYKRQDIVHQQRRVGGARAEAGGAGTTGSLAYSPHAAGGPDGPPEALATNSGSSDRQNRPPKTLMKEKFVIKMAENPTLEVPVDTLKAKPLLGGGAGTPSVNGGNKITTHETHLASLEAMLKYRGSR